MKLLEKRGEMARAYIPEYRSNNEFRQTPQYEVQDCTRPAAELRQNLPNTGLPCPVIRMRGFLRRAGSLPARDGRTLAA